MGSQNDTRRAEDNETPGTEPLWFAFRGDRLLVLEGEEPRVPRAYAPDELGVETSFSQPVGSLDGSPCWAAEVPEGEEAPEGAVFVDLRAIFAAVDEPFFAVAGRAKQVVGWHATHRSAWSLNVGPTIRGRRPISSPPAVPPGWTGSSGRCCSTRPSE